jgi:hypothetical protein
VPPVAGIEAAKSCTDAHRRIHAPDLGPLDARLPELEQDYRKMQEMIFGEPLAFERLLEGLQRIEAEINVLVGG